MRDKIQTFCGEVPVAACCDVAVAGGGVAGIAAALAAKRAGAKKVLLIDRQHLLGGLATVGLVTIYVPLCDGRGHLVSSGIAEELLRLSVSHGAEKGCPAWLDGGDARARETERFRVQFNAQLFALLCEELLVREGVEFMYGADICGVVREDDKISALVLHDKGGFSAVTVSSVVDATGDADICQMSGCPTRAAGQPNSLAAWYYAVDGGAYSMHQIGFREMPDEWDKDDAVKQQTDAKVGYTGLSGRENTRMSLDMHRAILKDFLSRGELEEGHVLATIPVIPQLRMTRRLEGVLQLNEADVGAARPDSVGMISDWRRRGPFFEVPFGCLYNPAVRNLTAAGRCISCTEEMWDVSRVISACAVTGQAAGTAAALCDDMPALSVEKLQEVLHSAGVLLHKNW